MTGDEILDAGGQVMAHNSTNKNQTIHLRPAVKSPDGDRAGVCHFPAQPSAGFAACSTKVDAPERQHGTLRQIDHQHERGTSSCSSSLTQDRHWKAEQLVTMQRQGVAHRGRGHGAALELCGCGLTGCC
jgi:hypothetical protein